MAIVKQKGLKFPKVDYKKNANGTTSFSSATETFTLPASANWNSNTYLACQLDHLPALAREAIGQTIADPVLTCTTDSSTRIINYKRPDGTQPPVGEVYLDIYNGIMQFNSADVSKAFSITYYIKGDLVDHNAMNRIWQSGTTYIIGDETWADFSDAQTCFNALVDGDSVKLNKDITTTGLTLTKKVMIDGNGKKIIKSGTAPNSRAINFSDNIMIKNVDFSSWSATGDVCLFTSNNVQAIITANKAIGCTKLTNVDTVATYCVVENNLPFSFNVGQAQTVVNNSVVNREVKQYTAATAISAGDPVFLDLTNSANVKKLSTVTDADVFIGIALSAVSSGATVNVATRGSVDVFSGLTAGKQYYVNKTGAIATVTFPNRPIPATSDTSGNGLGAGDWYPVYLGRSISTGEILLQPHKMNNQTPLWLLYVSGSIPGLPLNTPQTVNAGTTVDHTVFCNAAATAGVAMDSGGVPWELSFDLNARANGTATTFNVYLYQYETGTTNLQQIDRHSISLNASTTDTAYRAQRITLKNANPGAGQVIVRILTSSGSGSWVWFPSNFDFKFLERQ